MLSNSVFLAFKAPISLRKGSLSSLTSISTTFIVFVSLRISVSDYYKRALNFKILFFNFPTKFVYSAPLEGQTPVTVLAKESSKS